MMMASGAPPTPLLKLQNAESVASQAACLRTLKHELIGHDQRKETYVIWGILPILAQILASNHPSKVTSADSSEAKPFQYEDSSEYDACMQAIIISGTVAHGGPNFLPPIFASDLVSNVLAVLVSPDCPQAFTVPILRLLNAIADRLPLQSQEQALRDTRFADLIFSDENASALRRLVAQEYVDRNTQICIELAAALIGKVCTEEAHKAKLAECGVLDALGIKLAAFVVAQGYVLPGAANLVQEPDALGAFPAAAPASASLTPILRAIATIVEQSKRRAQHLLSSPGIVTVFPSQLAGFTPADVRRGPWGSTYLSGSAVPRQPGANPLDALLPPIPHSHERSSPNSTNFPPLGTAGSQRRPSSSYPTPFSQDEEKNSTEEEENSLVPYLLVITREESGLARLASAHLLSILVRLGLTRKDRVPMFSNLLVPILIEMLDKDSEASAGRVRSDDVNNISLAITQQVKEEAPAVLANLVMDDQEMQKYAVNGGALKRLSQLLKETYNPVSENLHSMWYAGGDAPVRDPKSVTAECRLGPPGYSPLMCHIMRYRENILKGLAALVPFKDEYRKAVCENGAVPYIIDSLRPRPTDAPANAESLPKNLAADGNPTPTILAACGATRMLTRSVSVLRTSLVDAGVAEPLFVLLKHQDVEVKTAATAVICNLALDFSPMKEAIVSADVIPILCEHAHSDAVKLKIESLWALKHLVYNTANDIKITVVEKLGPRWMLQRIAPPDEGEPDNRLLDEEMEQDTSVAMGGANSAGEHVDILNPTEEWNHFFYSVSLELVSYKFDYNTDPGAKHKRFPPALRRRSRLISWGVIEQNDQAARDQDAVREQTFDLIRNMICGEGAAEMIDYLFRDIGQDALLDTINESLKVRVFERFPINPQNPVHTINARATAHTELITAVTAVIVHLAAGLPRHRQLVVWHKDIMRSVIALLSHSHQKVRLNGVWVVINLLYAEDQNDNEGCRARAARLKELRVLPQLEKLEKDKDLDVRERTKTALHWLNVLS
ncbi:Armadillo [Penicillium argentinense]|uniref:Armadillo n=1 Tax=Penicillium argentinense TaxID=1131581 RepID=A0A9W9EYR9_9EURO|nr:Armadillo [Penicillium argentinense]KAJ5090336.1 Armadillo [Penicillium argentinense]